ncbi:U32 family peptidase [Shewanella sp. AS1]|uniref:U32 family peptidase n=1 Tax=Shewanella sp. AS1 TaxID=2907626 RepID=UPI001F204225|nr:U32 family peptidase [Shewanella sp. AS1]MCE9679120.1 U32 family peptidase [Shewanella sp. AS1]
MKTALGPIQYCWPKAEIEAFYQKVAETDIPLVYLGETVCSRRREVKFSDYLALAQMLKAAGKQVVLSTLTLIEAQSEFTALKTQVENGEFLIEANDMGAVQVAKSLGLPFICGPSVNNYNAATLKKLASWGMQRFVMPLELSKDWLEHVISELNPNPQSKTVEVEVFGHGYMSLAHSARCFTARNRGLSKDGCKTVCIEYPKGVLVQTQESQSLLRLNGIQTQSASLIDLRNQQDKMLAMGVDYFRVSPASMASIDIAANLGDLQLHLSQDSCNGYWFNQAGLNQHAT